jgi:hypothetical protein
LGRAFWKAALLPIHNLRGTTRAIEGLYGF